MATNSVSNSNNPTGAPSLPRAGHVSQLRNNWRVFEYMDNPPQEEHLKEIKINYNVLGEIRPKNPLRNRNQQIRHDLPQAKQIQSQEEEEAQRERERYRLELNSQALADERVALELALRQRGFLDDDEYTRRKDKLLAKSIEDIEKKYRKKNVEDFNPDTSYNDEEYRVQIAKPAVITDEPLYANYQEEKYMKEVSLNRPSSRTSQGYQQQRGHQDHNHPHQQQQGGGMAGRQSQMSQLGPETSPRNPMQQNNFVNGHNQDVSPPHRPVERSPPSGSNLNQDFAPKYGPAASGAIPRTSYTSSSGIHNASTSNSGSSGAPYHGSQPSSSSGRAVPAVPMPTGVGRPPPGPSAGSRPHSSLEASNRVPPLTEDLNTSSDYLTSRTSSRTSHRSDSSLTSYSEHGAVGYAPGYGPTYGACGVTLPGQQQPSAHRYKYNSHSSNDFDPMDSLTPRRGVDSHTARSEEGYLRGAVSLPVDEIGLRSALTPEEIRAAEAAEALIEQERKDAELALRLQEELELAESGPESIDLKLAQEAQDREYARALQAKEKARLKRAKEKARQRKLERQRLQQEADEAAANQDPDSIQYAPEENGEIETRLHSPRDEGRAQSRHSNNHQRSDSYQDGGGVEPRQQHDRVESRQESRAESRHDRTHSRISQVSPRDGGETGSRLSPLKEPDPPARRPYVHTQAIDSHINDTYCKTQITPTVSNSSSSVASSETSEPQYENLDKQGNPLKTEPILHLPSSKKTDKISPRQTALNEDMPVPPYMPMQSSASRKSQSLERKIRKKKEKEGCKQQ